MGTVLEMCNCRGQQVIVPNSKSLVENDINNNINKFDNNDNNINQNNTNYIEEKKNKKKVNNGVNNNEQKNGLDNFNNISSKGVIMTPKQRRERISLKKNDKWSQKDSENKKSKGNLNDRKEKKRRSKKTSEVENLTDNYESTKKNNIDIEENFSEVAISDTILSEIILIEKPKNISTERKNKIKGRNNINIVILGLSEVGKSSFCIRFVENKFEDFYIPSIGVENYSKIIAFNERNYKLSFSVIWGDIKNQKQENLLNVADFFFLVYDITKIRSFNQINIYLKQLKKYLFLYDKQGKYPNFCLIGNKSDLEGERRVGLEVVNKGVDKFGIKHFEISVKTARNMNNLVQFFVNIFDKIAFSDK